MSQSNWTTISNLLKLRNYGSRRFKTLPNLTIEKFLLSFSLKLLIECKQSSETLLEAPITFVGRTALSLEIKTRLETFLNTEAFTTD